MKMSYYDRHYAAPRFWDRDVPNDPDPDVVSNIGKLLYKQGCQS